MNQIDVDCRWWVLDAWENPKVSQFAVTAGLGAGKTHGLCQWHHLKCTQNQKSKFSLFFEPVYHLIHKAGIPTYIKVLNQFGYQQERDFKIVKSPYPKIIYLPTGHEVVFGSGDSPETIVAIEASHGTMDETGTTKGESLSKMVDRVRCNLAVSRQSLFGGVPDGLNHYAERFDSDVNEGWEKITNAKHFNARMNAIRYKFATTDNPYLPEDYIQNLIRQYEFSPALIKAYIYGEFCNLTQNLAIPNFKQQVHEIDYIEPDPYNTLDLSFDFNNNPVAWVLISRCNLDDMAGKQVKRWVVHDCATYGYGQLIESIREFAEKYPPYKYRNTRIRIYGDRSGYSGSHKLEGSDYDTINREMKNLGYQNVSIEAQKQVVLETDSLNCLDRLFYNNYIFITERCQPLKRSLNRTMMQKGIRKIDKPSGEDWTHFVDALKYWAYQVTRDFSDNKILGSNKGGY